MTDATNSSCGRQCYIIGGPWIAEDPECPVHGPAGVRDQERHDAEQETIQRIRKALALPSHATLEDIETAVVAKVQRLEKVAAGYAGLAVAAESFLKATVVTGEERPDVKGAARDAMLKRQVADRTFAREHLRIELARIGTF